MSGGRSPALVVRTPGDVVLEERDAPVPGVRTDAARRKVHDAEKRVVVVGIGDEPQVGERVFDLLPLEEAQASVNPVRDRRIEKRVLENA